MSGRASFEIPAWGAILFYFATNLLWAVVGMFSQHHGGGVAFGAHVGGFLGGLALMAIYKWQIRPRDEPEVQPGLVLDPAKVLGISTPRPQARGRHQRNTDDFSARRHGARPGRSR